MVLAAGEGKAFGDAAAPAQSDHRAVKHAERW
jgi:hypothetical protein